MKIAYMVLAHKNFNQLEMLIRALQDNDIELYIHVDKKNDELFFQLDQKYRYMEGITILQNRVNVNRGGFSIVQAVINLMKETSKKTYDYVTLISGQDYPIKPISHIKNYLQKHKGKEFIEGYEIYDNFWRLKCYNFFSENANNRKLYIRIVDNVIRRTQILLFLRRNNFKGLTLYKGSGWFTITYDCLMYMLDYIEKNPQYILDYAHTYVPDESFFQNLIMNSRFKLNRVNDDLMKIDWENSVKGSPRVYNVNDYDDLKSYKKLFARKFDMDIDKEILLKLESFISCKD